MWDSHEEQLVVVESLNFEASNVTRIKEKKVHELIFQKCRAFRFLLPAIIRAP